MPRSGILVVSLELGRWQVAERRAAALVVDLFDELADRSTRFGVIDGEILVQQLLRLSFVTGPLLYASAYARIAVASRSSICCRSFWQASYRAELGPFRVGEVQVLRTTSFLSA